MSPAWTCPAWRSSSAAEISALSLRYERSTTAAGPIHWSTGMAAMSRSPGRKCTGASTCVYAWQAMVRMVLWKLSPRWWALRSSLATVQRKWGRIGNERSTIRMVTASA
jgi:hypothetical protein